MDFKIRENKNGSYIIINSNDFHEGINFVKKNKLNQIQLRGAVGKEIQTIDFKLFDSISNQLQILSFAGLNDKITEFKNIDSIYQLSNLKKLYIDEKQTFKLDVANFFQLEELGVALSNNIVGVNIMADIKILTITSGYLDENIESLKNLNSLESLHIYKSTKIINLFGISELKNLNELKVAYCNKIRSIEEINTSNCEILAVEKCKLLTDFSFLKNNSTIKELFIDSLESLEFVETMPNLEKINFWFCKDGNMKPLLESKSLKQINFHPNKKHYSHTIEEIIEITGAKRGRHN